MSEAVFRVMNIHDSGVRSFTLGLVAHAIGVARVIQMYPGHLAFAALAMGLNGIGTALVLAAFTTWG